MCSRLHRSAEAGQALAASGHVHARGIGWAGDGRAAALVEGRLLGGLAGPDPKQADVSSSQKKLGGGVPTKW